MESGAWRSVLTGDDAEVLAVYRRDRDTSWGPDRTALVVIDAVESFVGPNLPVRKAQVEARTACGEYAWAALPHIRRLLDRFHDVGLPVVYTVVSSQQAQVGAATRGVSVRDDALSSSRVVPELAPGDDDLVIAKNKASAFFETSLISYLIRNGVSRIVLTGGATSGCVRATAVDATSYGFDVRVAEDATFDRVELLHKTALLEMDTKYGHVVTTDEVLENLPS